MVILGISPGFESGSQTGENFLQQDASGLVVDGQVVSAIDTKRLLKMKTNGTALPPLASVDFVLTDYGIKLKNVDKIALLGSEDYWHRRGVVHIQDRMYKVFQELFHRDFSDKDLFFVNHHAAYGMNIFPLSGFKQCLFLTLHNPGTGFSVEILKREENRLERLDSFSFPGPKHRDALEKDIIDALANYQREFGYTGLCITGNTIPPGALEEKIRSSEFFEDIFVLLAEHAAGWAMGAALFLYYQENSRKEPIKKKFETFRNDTEKALVHTWQELLSKEKISINDNFFELGGNSLTIMKVSKKLEELFNREIPAASLFRYPTIRELAQYLDSKEAGQPISISDEKIDRSISVMEETSKLLLGDPND